MSAALRAGPLAALLAGCGAQYGYTSLERLDVFEQARVNTVDILLVVDDSCSMEEEQDKLGRSFDGFIAAFEEAEADWRIGVITTDVASAQAGALRGGGDELLLRDAEGRLLDEVAWDEAWPLARGQALQLDTAAFSPLANDAASAWCAATSAWAGGDLGSPGGLNPGCGGAGFDPPTPSGLRRAPLAGDLVIAEVLVDPAAVADAQGEWIELQSLSADELDLSGCTLADRGRNAWTLPEGARLPAGGRLLLAREADPARNGGLSPDLVAADGFSLSGPERVLHAGLPDAAALFAEIVAVGTAGSGAEMGMEATRRALVEGAAEADGAPFLREEARLAVLVVSDEEDSSPRAIAAYLRELGALKGDAAFRTPGVFTVSAIAGVDPPPYAGAPSCESVDATAAWGERYVAAVQATGGVAASICEADFAPLATELGLLASGLDSELALSALPDEDSLRVRVYEDRDEESLLYEARLDLDFVYLSESNAIRFLAHAVPPSQSVVVVEYRLAPEGG